MKFENFDKICSATQTNISSLSTSWNKVGISNSPKLVKKLPKKSNEFPLFFSSLTGKPKWWKISDKSCYPKLSSGNYFSFGDPSKEPKGPILRNYNCSEFIRKKVGKKLRFQNIIIILGKIWLTGILFWIAWDMGENILQQIGYHRVT